MKDKELLELAAKAASIDGKWNSVTEQMDCVSEEGFFYWNPLEDDGDAQRLAVKLGLIIEVSKQDRWTFIFGTCCDADRRVSEKHGNDPYAATRRAIVRAGAEIGKQMKGDAE